MSLQTPEVNAEIDTEIDTQNPTVLNEASPITMAEAYLGRRDQAVRGSQRAYKTSRLEQLRMLVRIRFNQGVYTARRERGGAVMDLPRCVEHKHIGGNSRNQFSDSGIHPVDSEHIGRRALLPGVQHSKSCRLDIERHAHLHGDARRDNSGEPVLPVDQITVLIKGQSLMRQQPITASHVFSVFRDDSFALRPGIFGVPFSREFGRYLDGDRMRAFLLVGVVYVFHCVYSIRKYLVHSRRSPCIDA